MRILQITSHLNVGGITRYILSLSQRLTEKGHRVMVASDGGNLEGRAAAMGLEQWRIPLKTSQEFSLKVFRSIGRIVNRLEREPVDVIHAHTRVAQVVADQVSRRTKIPYVTTWHGIYQPRLGRRLYPCMGERCIAISGVVRDQVMTDFRLPLERVRLIYNGVDPDHYSAFPDPAALRSYRRRWRILEGQPLIGGIGRLAAGKVKGFDLLLAAACLVKEKIPGIQVLIVGDGPRRPFLEDVAERLGILDNVHFAGEAEDIRVPLALMDVFVFPSRWPEAFGLTLVEAMAAGKPVVATRIGAVPEIIREGIDGFLVPPEDIEALAKKAVQLFSDQPLAGKLAAQARARVREKFSLDRLASEVEQVYKEVFSCPRQNSPTMERWKITTPAGPRSRI